jgi:bifunctional ADP-heptose synthase (sugar kinase/adenylyltransferase)
LANDDRGKLFLELMEEQFLSDIGLVVDEQRVTTQKTSIISAESAPAQGGRGDGCLCKQARWKRTIPGTDAEACLESGGIDAVILQDYDKGVLSPKVIDALIRAARERVGVPVLVDPKFRSFEGVQRRSNYVQAQLQGAGPGLAAGHQ